MTELVIVPTHLAERIERVLDLDIGVPPALRDELKASLDSSALRSNGDDGPPTIDISILERLSRWATSDDISARLHTHGLGENSVIPLSHVGLTR